MKQVAREHGLMRLEGFRLIAPQDAWHRAWVIEFPTMAGAEAWMEAEVQPTYGTYSSKVYYPGAELLLRRPLTVQADLGRLTPPPKGDARAAELDG